MTWKRWECYEPEMEEPSDARFIMAYSADDAAEKLFEEHTFHEDGDFAERIVLVREAGTDGGWRRFRVVPEATVVFHVYED